MGDFTFGQVEAVLASLNRIADHKRVAFMSRLKHLQKNGLPKRNRPGRGKAGTYTFGQLMQMAVGVDLLQSGLPPQLAATIVTSNWSAMWFAVHIGTFTEREVSDRIASMQEAGEDVEADTYCDQLWMIGPEALRDLSVEGVSEWDYYDAVMPVPVTEASKDLLISGAGTVGERWRTLVINGTALTRAVVMLMAFQFRFASVEDMRADLRREMDEYHQQLDVMRSLLKDGEPLISDPVKREELKRKLAHTAAHDFSTNPPTPPEVLLKRAGELIPLLSRELVEVLLAPDGDHIEISETAIKDMVRFHLFELDNPTSGLVPTTFGKVVVKELQSRMATAQAAGQESVDGDRS